MSKKVRGTEWDTIFTSLLQASTHAPFVNKDKETSELLQKVWDKTTDRFKDIRLWDPEIRVQMDYWGVETGKVETPPILDVIKARILEEDEDIPAENLDELANTIHQRLHLETKRNANRAITTFMQEYDKVVKGVIEDIYEERGIVDIVKETVKEAVKGYKFTLDCNQGKIGVNIEKSNKN